MRRNRERRGARGRPLHLEDADAPPPFIIMESAAEGGRARAGPAQPGPSASQCERGLAYMFF